MSTQFENALSHVLAFEGGYADDHDDSGGKTFRGITYRDYPNWEGWTLIDSATASGHKTAKAIDEFFRGHHEMARLVAKLYESEFWDKVK